MSLALEAVWKAALVFAPPAHSVTSVAQFFFKRKAWNAVNSQRAQCRCVRPMTGIDWERVVADEVRFPTGMVRERRRKH